MIRYPDKALEMFIEALYNDDKAVKWLLTNGYPELAAVKESIVNEKTDAHNWLLHHNKVALYEFVRAVQGSGTAVKKLLRAKEPLLAATANTVCGDHAAKEWLQKMGYSIWAEVADAIFNNLPEDEHTIDVD